LRGGFPEGGELKINRRARSLSDCALEAGVLVEAAVEGLATGGLGPPFGFAAPSGLTGALRGLEDKGGVAASGWLVDWLVGSGVGVESMSLINDYNSNFWCRCNLYAIYAARLLQPGTAVVALPTR